MTTREDALPLPRRTIHPLGRPLSDEVMDHLDELATAPSSCTFPKVRQMVSDTRALFAGLPRGISALRNSFFTTAAPCAPTKRPDDTPSGAPYGGRLFIWSWR